MVDEKDKNDQSLVEDFTKEKLTEAAWFDVQCNFTAILYMITEQQALIGKLLEELVRLGALKGPGLERVTSIKSNQDDFGLTYADVHKRFSNYFYAVRKIMSDSEAAGTEGTETEPDDKGRSPNGDFNAPK